MTDKNTSLIHRTPDDVFGDGWRIAWVGPDDLFAQDQNTELPAGSATDTVTARVIDAEIGHRTLKPHDDKPIRFRYLLHVKVKFEYGGRDYTAVPVCWHHEFESRDEAIQFCRTQLGYRIQTDNEPQTESDQAINGQTKGEQFQLNISRTIPQLAWLSPSPPGGRVTPPFDIVISMNEKELLAHKEREKRTSPLLWGIKLAILLAIFIGLWFLY